MTLEQTPHSMSCRRKLGVATSSVKRRASMGTDDEIAGYLTSPDDSPRARNSMKPSRKPQPKIVAGSVAGAASIALVWTAGQFGVELPPEVASAYTLLLMAIVGYLKAN